LVRVRPLSSRLTNTVGWPVRATLVFLRGAASEACTIAAVMSAPADNTVANFQPMGILTEFDQH
jgi:hypothetical protein